VCKNRKNPFFSKSGGGPTPPCPPKKLRPCWQLYSGRFFVMAAFLPVVGNWSGKPGSIAFANLLL